MNILWLALLGSLFTSVAMAVRERRARKEAARLVKSIPALLSTTIEVWEGPADEVQY